MQLICCLILCMPLMILSEPHSSEIEVSINPIETHIHIDDDLTRPKRSGSGSGSFSFLGAIAQGLTSSLGRASATFAGGSSSSSSSGSGSSSGKPSGPGSLGIPAAPPRPPVDVSTFDGWALKRSILNTIFQAVKAITGGIAAINGQLIKGSGYAISAGGKLVAASGDAVTNVGKKIALSAQLIPPSSSHFAKYAGASSASSSSSSSSASSSASSSSSSSSSSHGPSSNGESYISYETPPSGGHVSYGPPSQSALSGPGPTIVDDIHVNIDASPPGHDQGYSAHFTSYGTPAESPPASIHLNTGYKATKTYDTPIYFSSITSGHSGPSDAKSQSIHNAADALRDILNKLPITKDKTKNDDNPSTGYDYSKPIAVEQYEIPPDPIPKFKPIQSHKIYDKPFLGPIGDTHTQSISASYLPPSSSSHNDNDGKWSYKPSSSLSTFIEEPYELSKDNDGKWSYKPSASSSYIEKPIELTKNKNDDKWSNIPIGPGASSQTHIDQPLNIYHTMSLKLADNSHPNHHNTNSFSSNSPSALPLLSSSNSLSYDSSENSHEEWSQENLIRQDYEIQKSVGYELRPPPPIMFQRRIFKRYKRGPHNYYRYY